MEEERNAAAENTEREIITKDSVSEELLLHVKLSMPFAVIAFALGAIFLLPIAGYLIAYVVNGFIAGEFGSVRIVFAFLVSSIAGLLMAAVAGSLAVALGLRKKSFMAKNGDFSVTEDTLLKKANDEAAQKRRRKEMIMKGKSSIVCEDVFYFEKHGRYVVGRAGGDIFETAEEGDVFYIASYNTKKAKPALIFNSRTYKYEENKQIKKGD